MEFMCTSLRLFFKKEYNTKSQVTQGTLRMMNSMKSETGMGRNPSESPNMRNSKYMEKEQSQLKY